MNQETGGRGPGSPGPLPLVVTGEFNRHGGYLDSEVLLSNQSDGLGMKCLIIAAGNGSRLQQKGGSKPLVPILGVPLIERVIRSAMEGGADEFYVVRR